MAVGWLLFEINSDPPQKLERARRPLVNINPSESNSKD